MSWRIEYLDEALEDLYKLDNADRQRVLKALKRVSQNPLPQSEGGYGKPLGNKGDTNLSGFQKIKLKSNGVRVVYALERVGEEMLIIIIGVRADDEVYREAQRRRNHYGL